MNYSYLQFQIPTSSSMILNQNGTFLPGGSTYQNQVRFIPQPPINFMMNQPSRAILPRALVPSQPLQPSQILITPAPNSSPQLLSNAPPSDSNKTKFRIAAPSSNLNETEISGLKYSNINYRPSSLPPAGVSFSPNSSAGMSSIFRNSHFNAGNLHNSGLLQGSVLIDNSIVTYPPSTFKTKRTIDDMYEMCVERSEEVIRKCEMKLQQLKVERMQETPNAKDIFQELVESNRKIKLSSSQILGDEANKNFKADTGLRSLSAKNKETSILYAPVTAALAKELEFSESSKKESNNNTKAKIDDPLDKANDLFVSFKSEGLFLLTANKAEEDIQVVENDNINRAYSIDDLDEGKNEKLLEIIDPANEERKIQYLEYKDGTCYQGETIEMSREGYGTLFVKGSHQKIYEGEWKDDKFHGKGHLTNKDARQLKVPFDYRNFQKIGNFWSSYEGNFYFDDYTGYGILFLTNGEKFWGEFKEGFIDGKGIFYSNSNPNKIKGRWEKNQLVEEYNEDEFVDPDARDILNLISKE